MNTPAKQPAPPPPPIAEPVEVQCVFVSDVHVDSQTHPGIVQIIGIFEPPPWSAALAQRRVTVRLAMSPLAAGALLGRLETAVRRKP